MDFVRLIGGGAFAFRYDVQGRSPRIPQAVANRNGRFDELFDKRHAFLLSCLRYRRFVNRHPSWFSVRRPAACSFGWVEILAGVAPSVCVLLSTCFYFTRRKYNFIPGFGVSRQNDISAAGPGGPLRPF